MIYVIHWFVNILTLGLVSIATITTTTYHVDEPITELNNQSLNDVFLDNSVNVSSVLNTYVGSPVGSGLLSLPLISLNNYGYIYFYDLNTDNYPYSFGDVYFRESTLTGSFIQWVIYNNSLKIQTKDFSILLTNTQSTDTNKNVQYKYIELNQLGIENLTQSQLDDWYDIYLQAVANNGVYIESTSHLNNNIHLVDVSVMVISFGLWVWLFKFLKGVIF